MGQKAFLIVVPFVVGLSCSEPNDSHDSVNKSFVYTPTNATNDNHIKVTNYFPFKIYDDTDRFTVMAILEEPELYPKYADFFEKYGYEGNGYCWEGHITQILEKIQPELLQHVDFDPEAGGFYAYLDTKENQLKFVELLSPIFSDLTKLAVYVKKADHSRVDD